MVSQKDEAVESSRKSLLAADSLRPETETASDCSDKNLHSGDTDLTTSANSMQPTITLTQLNSENQQAEGQAEPLPTSQDVTTISATSTGNVDQDLSLHHEEEENASQVSSAQESPAELPAGSRQEANSEPAAAAEDANEEEAEAPAGPGRKNSAGKAKATAKRRSGRATNRR